MVYDVLFLLSFAKAISSGVIDECFVENQVNNQAVRRPSQLAQACSNNNQAFCAELFDPPANVAGNNANP